MRIMYGGVNDLKQGGFLSWMFFIDQCSFFYNVVVYKIAPKYSCALLFCMFKGEVGVEKMKNLSWR